MKIGVLSDTYLPGRAAELPARVHQAFRDLDILLHLGDITELPVLRELQERFTLTFAVAGERDSDDVRAYVEQSRVVSFGQRRIAMIHGHQFETQRARWRFSLRRLLGLRPDYTALPAFLLNQFSDVDAIVFGHTYRPFVKMYGGVLLFNPGTTAPMRGYRSSVGILDMGDRTITGKIVYLE
jgi:putative phosphoesterase